ncbi:IS3 family transposase [Stutzerimonas kunmingensis]|uniref:IS3 family transposase n=1 Tax=Stutzerimonas kunmingensis TaxID=1211807 RepID=UPI0035E4620C
MPRDNPAGSLGVHERSLAALFRSDFNTTVWFCSIQLNDARGIGRRNEPFRQTIRSLKAERVYLTRNASYHEAKTDLFGYIRFYNHRLRHSRLGYVSPMEFEQRYASSNS